jgi:hypothetical protein
MDDELNAWQARAQRCRDALEPLRFLVGRFEGCGQDSGQPVRCEAVGTLRLDGSWLELRERLLKPDGALLYEDFALYRFDPAEEGLRVLHFMERAWHTQYPVHLDAQGALRWTTGVGGPRVRIAATEQGWESRVTMPEEPEPTVVLEYRRVGGGEPGV